MPWLKSPLGKIGRGKMSRSAMPGSDQIEFHWRIASTSAVWTHRPGLRRDGCFEVVADALSGVLAEGSWRPGEGSIALVRARTWVASSYGAPRWLNSVAPRLRRGEPAYTSYTALKTRSVGYRAASPGGLLRVSCAACAAVPLPDHAWRLTTTPPAPAAAEVDDAPYADVVPRFVERPVDR